MLKSCSSETLLPGSPGSFKWELWLVEFLQRRLSPRDPRAAPHSIYCFSSLVIGRNGGMLFLSSVSQPLCLHLSAPPLCSSSLLLFVYISLLLFVYISLLLLSAPLCLHLSAPLCLHLSVPPLCLYFSPFLFCRFLVMFLINSLPFYRTLSPAEL